MGDLMRSTYEDWRVQAHEDAVEICRAWLRSCEHFRGGDNIDPAGGPALEDLLGRLGRADVRFRRLASRPEEQRKLVVARLHELKELKKRKAADDDDGE